MRRINNYILEKLHIGKGMKNHGINTDTVCSCIFEICGIPFDSEKYADIRNKIENWAKDNEIEDFDQLECIIPLNVLYKRWFRRYDYLKEEGWLDKKNIRSPFGEEQNIIARYMNTENTVCIGHVMNNKITSLFIPKEHPDRLIYYVDAFETYFYFRKIK